jgi:hypothetical protein
MRNSWKLTLVLAFGGIILAAALPVLAVDFSVNACCLNTTAVSGGGQMKTVSVHVSTNETDANASLWVAYVTLQVKGSDGFQCSTQGFKETHFHPMVVMPVRFQVVYPKPPLGGKDDILLPPHKRLRPVKYTVTATITKITPLSSGTFPPGDTPENNSHTWPYDLPGGGTPTCANVAGPN